MIAIVDYDPAWPEAFEAISARLRDALGTLALAVDHIGSTSVPGLGAKDRIDVQITVASASDFDAVRLALEPHGFTQAAITCDHVPPGQADSAEQWEKRFFRPPADHRPANIHVRVDGRANQRYPLLFRDYLRSNKAAAQAYENLKKQLAHYHGSDSEAYCDIKDPACDLIAIAAEAWAKDTGWKSPGAQNAISAGKQ